MGSPSSQNEILRAESHKINHRLAALERLVSGRESGRELAVAHNDIQRLSLEYQHGLARLKHAKPPPSTKISTIDALLAHFSARCAEHQIGFNLVINGSIPYMAEHIVPQSRLETMLGDHLEDALIAVNAGSRSFRGILMLLGLAEDCYALTVFDSGVAFEPDILMRLGHAHVTTRAGGGIGFMTTFETMRDCRASLTTREYTSGIAKHTKSVTICFDGKHPLQN